jgi:limonene-1,2-epoxide hydrolase
MTETIPAPSGIGTVLLDIGADTGALILHAPAELNGVEIEISRNGAAGAPRTHSRVRERRVGAAVRHAAVYPAVPTGTYTVWRDAITPVATVSITGGSVTSCQWPT